MVLKVMAHVLLTELPAELGPGSEVVHVVVRVVVEQVAADESSEEGVGLRGAEDKREGEEEEDCEGIDTAGGMTSRSLSFGWSWWMPWMMKCIRRPKVLSGSQWKTSRWSQYSVSVQMPTPPRLSAASFQAARPPAAPSHSTATTTGTKTIAGIAGCTREKKLRKPLSKSGGEAASRSVGFSVSIRGSNGSDAGPDVRKTRGRCDGLVSKTLRFAGMRATEGRGGGKMRRHGTDEEAAHLRGLLLPEEPSLRAGAGGALHDLSAQPARGPRASAPAGPAHAPSALGGRVPRSGLTPVEPPTAAGGHPAPAAGRTPSRGPRAAMFWADATA